MLLGQRPAWNHLVYLKDMKTHCAAYDLDTYALTMQSLTMQSIVLSLREHIRIVETSITKSNLDSRFLGSVSQFQVKILYGVPQSVPMSHVRLENSCVSVKQAQCRACTKRKTESMAQQQQQQHEQRRGIARKEHLGEGYRPSPAHLPTTCCRGHACTWM